MSRLSYVLRAPLLAGLTVLVGCASENSERPNVLLLSLDSVRADRISATGYRPPLHPDVLTTPNIDRLAREGVLFENAFSTTSWTLPSHMAMFTGLHDELHGVIDKDRTLDPGIVTLPELLEENGWTTGGFYSGPYLNPIFGFGQGFDHYVNCGTVIPPEVFDETELGRWREIHQFSHETVTSPDLLEEASAWIKSAVKRPEPFFAMVHWWDPHYDYKAPAEYLQMFDTQYTGEWTGLRNEDVRRMIEQADIDFILSLYDAELRYTDDYIGKLLELLEELGVADETLVIVTSDHGEEFYERSRWGHQRSLFDEVLRVPLVIRLPGSVPSGVRASGLARLQDIYPTIAELLGLESPSYLSGESLRPLWEDADHEGFRQPLHMLVPHRDINISGFRTPSEKVLWDHTAGNGSYWNLERDPEEMRPRLFDANDLEEGKHPALAELRDYLKTVESSREALPLTGGDGRIELDEGMLRELDATGYLGSDPDEEPLTPTEKNSDSPKD